MQNYENIPHEMRLFKQWCVWRYEETDGEKLTKVPYSALNGRLASVTDESTWCTFDQAIDACKRNEWYSGIGFVLTEFDPYVFIDLDDPYAAKPDGSPKHSNAKEILDRQINIYNQCVSYTERSPSGNGVHIICRGVVPAGRKRNAVEIYSTERYMTMTGDVYRNVAISDCNTIVNAIWQALGGGSNAAKFYFQGEPQKESDDAIWQQASNAENGEKFKALWNGDFGQWYTSHSEADLSLINMLAFYTQNKEQIFRMFRASALGQRDKAKRLDYFNWNVNKAFDRMLPPIDMEGFYNQIQDAIAKDRKKDKPAIVNVIETVGKEGYGYTVPPGLLGQIAQFIFDQAPRPVPEIALAGAIGFLSGIVGRAYNISGTGLNQYLLLLAPTGTGKEAIASGIDKLMNAILRTVPAAHEFVGPAEISSAQALAKHLSKTSASFMSLIGECGIMLQQMCTEHAAPHLVGLRRMFLDLYHKSGEGKQLRNTIYSDKDKNTSAVTSPAFTLLGESTPEKFYETLHEGMITEGLLPRFTIIEYKGARPELNQNHQLMQPSFQLVEQLSTLCAYALTLNSQAKAIHVKLSPEAQVIFDNFNRHCDERINGSDREIKRHLWNRAHIKALKLAALISIGSNPYQPCVEVEAAQWALDLVVRDVRNMLVKFDAGEIGVSNSETKQIALVIEFVRQWVIRPWSEIETYKVGNLQLHGDKVVPYAFLHKSLVNRPEFKKDRLGATGSVKRAIATLVERGDLVQVERKQLQMKYDTHAACYMIAIPRVFGIGN